MNIENRLQNHMREQADRIVVEPTDPNELAEAAKDGQYRTVSVLAAALVVLLAGAGFWMLSSDDPQVTEIAAGDPEDADEATSDDSGDSASTTGAIQQTDVSSDLAPGYGQVRTEDGVYYILSTAPGQVTSSDNLTDEEWSELFRPRTFYVLDEEDQQWQVSSIDDRFVSDFDVRDGVLYVVSTGSMTSENASLGSSSDRGETWNWTDLDGLPQVNQVSLLVGDDQSLIFAGRHGMPDWDQAITFANDAGLSVSDTTMQTFDGEGIGYIPLAPEDRCAFVAAQFVPEIGSFNEYIEEAGETERASLEAEYPEMIAYFKSEIENAGCEWDPAWETAEEVSTFDIPEMVWVPWDDIGVSVPESWKSWSSVFTFDGETLTDIGKPYDDDQQLSYADTTDGTLRIFTYPPFRGEVEAGTTENHYSTTDGINWDHQAIDYRQFEDDLAAPYPDLYYGPNFVEPKAGDFSFRIRWDEYGGEEYEDQLREAEDLVQQGEITEEEFGRRMFALEPQPQLQRRRAGGEWETIDFRALMPGTDFGDVVLQDVRGTSIGPFVVLGQPPSYNGPPEPGMLVLHSGDGTNWSSFELDGNGLDVYSDTDSALVFSHRWDVDSASEALRSQAFLIREAD